MEYKTISISAYPDKLTPSVPLTVANEKFFLHIFRANSLFHFVWGLLVKADKLNELARKMRGVLGAEEKEAQSFIDSIKEKFHHLDSFYAHEEFYCQLIYCSTVDAYVIYLQDVLLEIALAKPEILRSQEKVTIDDVLEHDTYDGLVDFLARRKVNDLSNSGLKGLFSFFSEKLGIACLSNTDECSRDVAVLYEARNCVVHEGGVISEKFVRLNPDYSDDLGKRIKFDLGFMDATLRCLLASVKKVDELVIKKFGLVTKHQKVEEVMVSVVGQLPVMDKVSAKFLTELQDMLPEQAFNILQKPIK